MSKEENSKSSSEFLISKIFDAPRELIFQMFNNTQHLKNWIPVGGLKATYLKSDISVGKTVHYYVEVPGGKMWGKAAYREIQMPHRIVYVQSFSDENEGITAHPMSPNFPKEMLTTIVFEDEGKKTKLTLTWIPINASDQEIATFESAKGGMSQGWAGSFNQLDVYLQNFTDAAQSPCP